LIQIITLQQLIRALKIGAPLPAGKIENLMQYDPSLYQVRGLALKTISEDTKAD
jgi:hypothetical protein